MSEYVDSLFTAIKAHISGTNNIHDLFLFSPWQKIDFVQNLNIIHVDIFNEIFHR